MNSRGETWFQVVPAHEVNIAPARGRSEPSLGEILLMFAAVSIVHVLTVCRVRSFWDLAAKSLDNGQYLQLATIIRSWHPTGGEVPHHFWGFPYAIAGISKLFSISPLTALVAISVLSSLAVCILVHRLYGGWVAAAVFSFINYRWIYASVEGGSEPLFMCLLFASFLASRSDRWNIAALLAALSTTVRPVGVFALLAFAAVLAMRRSFRQLTVITLIGLAIGMLYVVPLWIILGSPFANFIGYEGDWETPERPVTYPFGALVPGYLAALRHTSWPNLVVAAAWVVLAVVGIVALWLSCSGHRSLDLNRPEALFVSTYVIFFVSLNADYLALSIPRYLMPVLPLLLLPLRGWIPKDRRMLWAAATFSALLASAAMVGFKNVFGFRLP